MGRAFALVSICFVASGFYVSPSFAKYERCGPPPELVQDKSKESSSVITSLDGKANALSKLIGSAELGGQVKTDRETIFKDSPPASAIRQDAYLAYVFCTLLEDSNADLPAKLKALQEFRKPLSSIPQPAVAYIETKVVASSARAREEADKARRKAKEYPESEVGASLTRVGAAVASAYTSNAAGKAPDIIYSTQTHHWGGQNGIGISCCRGQTYVGEFSDGDYGGYGMLTTTTVTIKGRFSKGRPDGYGCTENRGESAYVSVSCGSFSKATQTFVFPSGVVSFVTTEAGKIVQQYIGEQKEDGTQEGVAVLTIYYDGSNLKSGGRYEGQISRNARNGYGVGYFADGSVYEGQWLDRERNGYGRQIGGDGRILQAGYWSADRFDGPLASDNP